MLTYSHSWIGVGRRRCKILVDKTVGTAGHRFSDTLVPIFVSEDGRSRGEVLVVGHPLEGGVEPPEFPLEDNVNC